MTPLDWPTELYDLNEDPGEKVNVAAAHAAEVDRLKRAVLDWHARMPPDNGATYRAPVGPKGKKK